jgi:hypothetical protein
VAGLKEARNLARRIERRMTMAAIQFRFRCMKPRPGPV